MSKYVAIDVGTTTARYLLADVGRGKVRVAHFGTVDLEEPLPDRGRLEALGQQLKVALGEVGGLGARAIVAIHRGDVEIRRFKLPPATDDELVDLVTAQVQSEAGTSGDVLVIDFVPEPADPDTERRAEAIVATQKTLDRYGAFCSAAGVKLRRVVLRPYTVASLPGRIDLATSVAPLVNVLDSEIDLTVLSGDFVPFWRTIQLGGEAGGPTSSDTVGAEIVRTLTVAATRDSESVAIDELLLLGSSEDHAHWTASLAEEAGLPASVVDLTKADGVSQGEEISDRQLASPLLAMLLAEADGKAPAIDLLDPRKPRSSRSAKWIASLAAVVVIAALFVAGDWAAGVHAEAEDAGRKLQSELTELRKQGSQLKSPLALARSIAAWENSGVIWLDELRDLALKFPASQDVVVRGMTISSLRNSGAMIRVTGQVHVPAVVVQMDHDLRDAYRNATSTNFREQSPGRTEDDNWRFETVITTRRRSPEAYRAALGIGAEDRTAKVPNIR